MHIAPTQLWIAGAALALAATPLAAQQQPAAQPEAATPYHTASCPVPSTVRGYPVTVRAAEGSAPLDAAFAQALADSIARRWEVPSPRRASFPGVDEAKVRRLDPPVPVWADDWYPGTQHVARFEVTMYRDGPPAARSLAGATDRVFDASVATIFDPERRVVRSLPPIPAAAGDSLRVLVGLGVPPEAGDAVVLFAAQQSQARVVPNSFQIRMPNRAWGEANAIGPRAPGVVVRYDVDAVGRAVPASIEVLRASSPAFGRAVSDALREAAFTPAQADCKPIARSVVQSFGRP